MPSKQDSDTEPIQGHSRSIIPYPGGKSQLGPWIVDHFPAHKCYVEAFGGSAAVLLSKDPSRIEVYNDRDGDLVHFFETFRDETEALVEFLRTTPYARDLHKKWAGQYYAGYRPDDDVERAARFFYLRFSQFAGKYNGVSGFRTMRQRSPAEQMAKARENLHHFARRFDKVNIENLDYSSLFDRFDGAGTLFYCDPPYVSEGDALYTGDAFDHERFVDELLKLEGDWIVSYTDLPSGLSDYHVVEKAVQYSSQDAKTASHKEATERLVMNFNPAEVPQFVDERTAQLTLAETDGGRSVGVGGDCDE